MGSFSSAFDWLGVQRAWTRTRGSPDVTIANIDTALPAEIDFAGLTGVAPAARILSVQYAPNPGAQALDLGHAIEYAAEHGACIINIAPGANLGTPLVQRAIQYAAARNALVVCGACGPGDAPLSVNDAANVVRVLGVDADCRPLSNHSGGTNGATAHLGAPAFTRKYLENGSHDDAPAPAAASAFVSGCAALVKTQNPGWGYHELREHLLASGTPREELNGHCAGGPLLNAANAVLGPIDLTDDARALTWSSLSDASLEWKLRYRSALCVNVVALHRSHGDLHWRELAFARAGALRMTVPAASLRRSSGVLRLACRESNFYADDLELTIR